MRYTVPAECNVRTVRVNSHVTKHVTMMSAGTCIFFHNHVPEGVAEGVVLVMKDKGHAGTVIWVVEGYLVTKQHWI